MVFIIVMMAAVLLLIGLTAVLPSVYQEGKREQEEETIFRGRQYGIAVARFHKQFNRFPVSTRELLETNGMRFLRKEYTDPLDPKGKWRFVHVNAAGVLLDSRNQPLNSPVNNPAGLGLSGASTTGTTPAGQGATSTGFGGTGPFGGQGTSSVFGQNMGGSSTASGIGPTSSFFGSPSQVQGAFIAGVAPTSHHKSIKVWNKHDHYDQWEFLGIDLGIFGIQVGIAGGAPGMMSQPSPQGPGFSSGPQGSRFSFGAGAPPSNFNPPSN